MWIMFRVISTVKRMVRKKITSFCKKTHSTKLNLWTYHFSFFHTFLANPFLVLPFVLFKAIDKTKKAWCRKHLFALRVSTPCSTISTNDPRPIWAWAFVLSSQNLKVLILEQRIRDESQNSGRSEPFGTGLCRLKYTLFEQKSDAASSAAWHLGGWAW